jgi:Protein of unknown function (DUF3224)
MTQTARGTFEVTITPAEDDRGVGRMLIAKTWTGDLAGEGHGQMLSAGDPTTGSAGYVAVEVVRGSLHGRRGSFAFAQHGVMRPGEQRLTYAVVPGSGTDDLAGIEGTLDLTIDGGSHSYAFTYTLR